MTILLGALLLARHTYPMGPHPVPQAVPVPRRHGEPAPLRSFG